ncbi:cysteine synthase A [Streptomyces sp. SceaMP-e96]|nr:pyridoxal-phosphate dependent enzyme [Streptomyces sp. SID4951]MYT14315.1 pyridoxal-phosphate dependent enzyme [Streptomyces sp. SID4951]SCK59432.1 cysteine synthase A [Streptomyces sp. SceaMP-e96]
MATQPPQIELSVTEPLEAAVDESTALAQYPGLRGFRATLGGTPLVEVPGPPGGARIMAKYELRNPSGSAKDRPAYSMLCRAINEHVGKEGPLKVVDCSGGNMARALTGLNKLTGIPVRAVMPDTVPQSLVTHLSEGGTVMDLVPASEFPLSIMRRASQIAEEDPSWTLLAQHRNMANVAAHQFFTGREIVGQLDGARPSAVVAAVGSGGMLAGVARALRSIAPDLSVIGVTPAELPYGTTEPPNARPKFAGAGGLSHGMRQPFVEKLLPEFESAQVSHPEALRAMYDFWKETGTRIGSSAGASWLIACEKAKNLGPDDIVVTVFADSGSKEDWEKLEGMEN